MFRLVEFRESLRQELSDPLYDLAGDKAFERWINVGQSLLGSYVKQRVAVSWAVGDTEFDLPADWHSFEKFVPDTGSCLPPGEVWGAVYAFRSAATSPGSGTLYYNGVRPRITGAAASTLSADADEALISYALYRFFKRIASSRSDYRMYATITQANGVDISELDDLSERHKLDFDAVVENVEPPQSVSFYDAC